MPFTQARPEAQRKSHPPQFAGSESQSTQAPKQSSVFGGQMFWQTVVEDRAADAVAAQFGVSTAAVRKARSRVLRRLKQEVGDAID